MHLSLHQIRALIFPIEDETLAREKALFSQLPDSLKHGTWQIISAQLAKELLAAPESANYFHIQVLTLQEVKIHILWTVKSWLDSEMKRQEARFAQEVDCAQADIARVTRNRIQHIARHIYSILKTLKDQGFEDSYLTAEACVIDASKQGEDDLKHLCDMWARSDMPSCYVTLEEFAKQYDVRDKLTWEKLMRK